MAYRVEGRMIGLIFIPETRWKAVELSYSAMNPSNNLKVLDRLEIGGTIGDQKSQLQPFSWREVM
jgi:hypothetical protein